MNLPKELKSNINMIGLAILVYGIGSLIAAVPFQFLWNRIMPQIFGVQSIMYIQAFGVIFLYVVSRIIFKITITNRS